MLGIRQLVYPEEGYRHRAKPSKHPGEQPQDLTFSIKSLNQCPHDGTATGHLSVEKKNKQNGQNLIGLHSKIQRLCRHDGPSLLSGSENMVTWQARQLEEEERERSF